MLNDIYITQTDIGRVTVWQFGAHHTSHTPHHTTHMPADRSPPSTQPAARTPTTSILFDKRARRKILRRSYSSADRNHKEQSKIPVAQLK